MRIQGNVFFNSRSLSPRRVLCWCKKGSKTARFSCGLPIRLYILVGSISICFYALFSIRAEFCLCMNDI